MAILANHVCSRYPVPGVPTIFATYLELEDATRLTGRVIESLGRNTVNPYHGRTDPTAGGGWVALTNLPGLDVDADVTWAVTWHPKFGTYAALHDSWASALSDVYYPNFTGLGHVVTSRCGGYRYIDGKWFRPTGQPVEDAIDVTADQLLFDPAIRDWSERSSIDPSEAVVGLIAPELMLSALVSLDEMASGQKISAGRFRMEQLRHQKVVDSLSNDLDIPLEGLPTPQVEKAARLWSRPVADSIIGSRLTTYCVEVETLNTPGDVEVLFQGLSLQRAASEVAKLKKQATTREDKKVRTISGGWALDDKPEGSQYLSARLIKDRADTYVHEWGPPVIGAELLKVQNWLPNQWREKKDIP